MIIAVTMIAAGFTTQQGKTVIISHNGETLYSLPLNKDASLQLTFDEGSNTVVIKDGAVYVQWADCGGDCVRSGAKSTAGSSIVCLPHKLVITVSGDDLDAVSG